MKIQFVVFLITLILFCNGCKDKIVEPGSDSMEYNYAKWKSLGINDYSIIETQMCFCIYGGVKAIVHVKNNQIISVQDSAGVKEIKQEYWQYYKTIDQLFEFLNRAVSDKPNSITIQFDKDYGFPKYFFIDPIQQAADDQYGYTTSSFKSLK